MWKVYVQNLILIIILSFLIWNVILFGSYVLGVCINTNGDLLATVKYKIITYLIALMCSLEFFHHNSKHNYYKG